MEKLLAAKRAKLTTVILPKRNKKDLDEIPKHILKGIHLVFADRDCVQVILTAHDGSLCNRVSAPSSGSF